MRHQHRRVTHLRSVDEKHEILARSGILLLDGEIDESSAYIFVQDIIHTVLKGFVKGKRLLVVLNSPGGNVEHGLAIHDAIKLVAESGTPVDVLGLGLVASMGTVIIQAGSRRLATPYTQFLVHQISRTIGFFQSEEVSELNDRTAELNRINNIVMGIIAGRSGEDLEELKKKCHKNDYWMSPGDALKLGTKGLIDEITSQPLVALLSQASAKR